MYEYITKLSISEVTGGYITKVEAEEVAVNDVGSVTSYPIEISYDDEGWFFDDKQLPPTYNESVTFIVDACGTLYASNILDDAIGVLLDSNVGVVSED